MIQTSVPNKRNLLYEMLLQLSGIEKRARISAEEVQEQISKIQSQYISFSSSALSFLQLLMKATYQYLRDVFKLQDIKNTQILESAAARTKEFKFTEEQLIELQTNLLKLLKEQIRLSQGISLEKKPITEDPDQILQYLLINFNRIDKKLGKLQLETRQDQETTDDNLVATLNQVLNRISADPAEEGKIEDLLAVIKELNSELKSKTGAFSLALIARGFKDGRISLERLSYLLKSKVRDEIIRAAMLWVLKKFGAQRLEKLQERLAISSDELFRNAITLLDRKELTISNRGHENYFDINREYPKLYRFLTQQIQALKKNIDKFSVLSKSMVNAILSMADGIFEKVMLLGSKSDQIYETEAPNVTDVINKLNAVFSSSETSSTSKPDQFRIKALIELYDMFRVKMVYEKKPYLIECSPNEDKQTQLDNFLLTATRIDFERGLLLSILREKGPLNTQELIKLSGLAPNTVVHDVLKLVKDKMIVTKGTKNHYFLYDIPRILTDAEKHLQELVVTLANLVNSYLQLTHFTELHLEDITKISRELRISSESLTKIGELSFDSDVKEAIQAENERVDNLLVPLRILEEKLPKTKSKFDLKNLAMLSLPRTEEEHANLIDPRYLVGFGDIEWDFNKCVACASCQEICPEAAVKLTNDWDLPGIFEMTEQQIDDLPENRRLLINLIKKVAVTKPKKSIKLPENTLGFGMVKYNPLMCIACRKCEEQCPNSALAFHEYWNFPEVMKILLREG